MVNGGNKIDTEREAFARGWVFMRGETLALVRANAFDKGVVLSVARIAGIMGGKNTSPLSLLIPLCCSLPLNPIGVEFRLNEAASAVEITAIARTTGKSEASGNPNNHVYDVRGIPTLASLAFLSRTSSKAARCSCAEPRRAGRRM